LPAVKTNSTEDLAVELVDATIKWSLLLTIPLMMPVCIESVKVSLKERMLLSKYAKV
jgi:hypothetical protein